MKRGSSALGLAERTFAILLLACTLLVSGCGVSDQDLHRAGQETGKLLNQGAEKANQFWQGLQQTINSKQGDTSGGSNGTPSQ